MSKIGNLRSGSYGGGNLHTYDGKGPKPRTTLADVRKAREFAKKKTQQAKILPSTQTASQYINKNQVTPNVPAVIQRPKNSFNSADLLRAQTQTNNFHIASQATPNVPVLYRGNTNTGSSAKIASQTPFVQGTQNLPSVVTNTSQSSASSARVAKGAASVPAEKIEVEVINQSTNEFKKQGLGSKIKSGFSNLSSKTKNLFSKAKSFFKSPKGKWGLVIAGALALGAGLLAYVADRFSDKYNPAPTDGPSKIFMPGLNDDKAEKTDKTPRPKETKDNNKNDKVKDNDTEKTKETENDSAVVLPVPVAETDDGQQVEDEEKTDKADDKTDKPEEKSKNDKTEDAVINPDIHKVVKGDNLWNIAKQNLKDLNKDNKDYEPSNKEILKLTEELMKINNKEYEKPLPKDSRKRKVLIVPDEEIKLK